MHRPWEAGLGGGRPREKVQLLGGTGLGVGDQGAYHPSVKYIGDVRIIAGAPRGPIGSGIK